MSNLVISEDELVSLEDLQDKVAEFEDYVQSTDVAAMQSTFRHQGLITPSDTFFLRALECIRHLHVIWNLLVCVRSEVVKLFLYQLCTNQSICCKLGHFKLDRDELF